MTTKIIGVREFRQNMAKYYTKARKNNWSLLIFSRNKPLFKVEALDDKDASLEKLALAVSEARTDIKKGRVQDFEEMCSEIGL
jgi:hypothetical protein